MGRRDVAAAEEERHYGSEGWNGEKAVILRTTATSTKRPRPVALGLQ
jgi:hypothetical protein